MPSLTADAVMKPPAITKAKQPRPAATAADMIHVVIASTVFPSGGLEAMKPLQLLLF
jgi:hypothetical protein